jgi:GntR family transcriptional regulator/MocR family aminotransferase
LDVPPIVLHRGPGAPLAVQLADALREAATGGALRAGDRLPSTRALAAGLGVSRTVTAAAYEQLHAEGWVSGRAGSGTYVTAAPPSAPGTATMPQQGGPAAVRAEDGHPAVTGGGGTADRARAGAGIDLRPGSPCTEVLDRAAWRRAWRAAADQPPDAVPSPAGLPAFGAAVVEHLLRHRGLPVAPAEVLATGGSTAAVGELAGTLPPGAVVAVEEPGYRRAAAALAAGGARVVPVPVDAGGLVVDALPTGLAALYCTPAHQYPLGARLAADRRVALVERARAGGFLVIEDDYDGELRYDVAPLPLLAALGPDVVAYLGTASKLLTPTLGVGWLAAPPAVRAALLAQRDRTGTQPAPAGQRVFAAMAAHGDLARHLRRLRRELAGRRAAVVAALAGAGIATGGDEAGAHVVAVLPDAAAERAAVDRAAARGVLLDGLARHHGDPPRAAGLVLGYAGPTRAELERALPVVTRVLRAA